MKILENLLAVVGLMALVYACVRFVLPLERVYAPEVTAMQKPLLCDATVSQGTYGNMTKPRCYIRGNK